MSNPIITCPECSRENKVGSKFCNHCGAKLPKSTNILCPRCQTPNPHDRLYCDNCGQRLVASEPVDEPAPQTEEPGSSKVFSLPTRRPGETGELDPNAVPDWLRTGQPQEDSQTDGDLPRLEDLRPKNKNTDDLPDWLVNEDDEDPIVHAPTIITTEHFQALLNPSESEDTEPETADIINDSDDADLPDWLSLSAQESEKGDSQPLINEDDLDWLASLSKPTTTDEPTAAAEPTDEPEPESEAPEAEELDSEDNDLDWLAGTYFLSEPAEDEEKEATAVSPPTATDVTDDDFFNAIGAIDDTIDDAGDATAVPDENMDWLDELGPPQTNIFDTDATPSDSQSGDKAEPIFASEQLPDWMEELGPPNTATLPSDSIDAIDFGGEDFDADEFDAEDIDADEFDVAATSAAPTLPPPNLEEIASSDTDLPDWFANLSSDDTSDSDLLQETNSDDSWLLGNDFPAGTSSLDWLNVTGQLPPLTSAPTEEEGDIEFDQLDDSFMDTEPPLKSESPDWLDELVQLSTGELSPIDVSPEQNAAADDDLIPEEPAEDLLAEMFADDPPSAEPEPELEPDTTAVPSQTTEDFLQAPIGSDLPNWLSQLDASDDQPDATSLSDELINSEDLPDWVSSMRPSSGQEPTGLATVFDDNQDQDDFDLFSDELEDITGDFAGTALPDWLKDASDDATEDSTIASDAMPSDTPDWLRDNLETAVFSDSATPDQSQTAEWDNILGSLPPDEELATADIPEWVQALKPRDLDAPVAPAVETVGPLAGLTDVIGIEPIIAQPRTPGTPPTYTISKDQMQQAALLATLADRTTGAATTTPILSPTTIAASLRILLALLLLAAIILGLVGPNILQTAVPAPNARITAVHDTITAADQPVLVAFDYTPAMAGDLTAQANLLLADLSAAGIPILTMSQYAAGTMMPATLTTEATTIPLGLVPGEAIGLRQLGNCLSTATPCTTFLGRTLDSDAQAALNNVGLIIVFTAERDSLVNWIEQVATPRQIPLIAGVSQSLAPVAAPYYASQQIQGILHGLPDAAVYAAAYQPDTDTNLDKQVNAQALVQLIAAVILLVGGLAMAISGGTTQKPTPEAKPE